MASTEKLQRENCCWPKKNKKADLIPKNILMVSKRFVCGHTRQKLNFFEGFHGGFATSGPGWPDIIDETTNYALYKKMFK